MRLIFLILLISPILCFGQLENTWTKKQVFGGGKRERAVAFSIGNFGYIGTGVNTSDTVLNDFWKYNPVNDTWTQVANLPGVARRDAVGFAIENYGYCGMGIDHDEAFNGAKLHDFYQYNPTLNSWAPKADFPGVDTAGVYFATAFTIQNKGYICGGKKGPNSYSNELWEYKPSVDTWTQRANFPGGVRFQMSSFSIGNYGIVGWGGDQNNYRKDVWKYNSGNNVWTALGNFPGSERVGACSFVLNEIGYICLGNNGGLLTDLWGYDFSNDTWHVAATYTGNPRKNAVSFVVNGKAYVGTGKTYSGKNREMYEYSPGQYLGLDETKTVQVNLFPNPTSENITIQLSKELASSKISIHNSIGQLVLKQTINNESFIQLNLHQLQAGFYTVNIHDTNNQLIYTNELIRL